MTKPMPAPNHDKPKWYMCETTQAGHDKYMVRYMYVRKSWKEGWVRLYSEKVCDHITQKEARELLIIQSPVNARLQASIEFLWDKKRQDQ